MRKGSRKNAAFIKGALALSALLSVLPSFSGAQSTPLDEKAKYERSLEIKVEEVLLKLLGPNQAKVVVQASMDFTKTEKLEVTSGAKPAEDKNKAFKWEGASAAVEPFNNYLLPGFPVLEPGPSDTQSYQKQMLFPTSFVKKLNVALIVNMNMTEPEIQSVRKVVAEILGLSPERGDDLSIIRTQFAPFWKTIWYSPDSMNLVFKYGILSIMGIVAMIVVSIGFLKLAGAMNTMAKAQQSHQITMDLGKGAMAAPGQPGPDAGLDLLDLAPGGKKAENEGGREEAPAQEKIVFNIRMDQAVFLVDIMNNEDPANVALVASHLAPDVRNEFLRLLPQEFSADVIANMVKVRFVDPGVINTIKEELERRLSGALGGIQQVVEVIGSVNLRAKREMLEKLLQKDPATALLVRKQIFLPEDLEQLSERDLSVLVGSFKIETLAIALWELPVPLRDKIKKQMADKTWQMVEQTMRYGAPSKENSEKAVEELIQTALKLMKETRISDSQNKSAGLAPRPGAPGPDAITLSAPGGEPHRLPPANS